MKLAFWKKDPEPKPKRERKDYMITIETGPQDKILAPYRDLLLDPIRSKMDYQKDCLMDKVRTECQEANRLQDLYEQFQEDSPERFARGMSGPDKLAFNALPVECQTCIVWKNAPGSDENLIKTVAEESGVELLEPTDNDAHDLKEILSGLLGYGHGIMSRIRGGGESPDEEEPQEPAPTIRPKQRFRELADPEQPPKDPKAVTPVQEPEPTPELLSTAIEKAIREEPQAEEVPLVQGGETPQPNPEPHTAKVDPRESVTSPGEPTPKPEKKKATKAPAKKKPGPKPKRKIEKAPEPDPEPEPEPVKVPEPVKTTPKKATEKKAPAKKAGAKAGGKKQ